MATAAELQARDQIFIGGRWVDAPKGSFVVAPGGTPHDFQNRTAKRAGALNVSVPGDFEPHMEGIAEWFRARSAADSRTENAPQSRSRANKKKTKDNATPRAAKRG